MTRRPKIVLATLGLVVALVAGLGWWLGLFSAEPEEATVEAALEAVSATTSVAPSEDDASSSTTQRSEVTAPVVTDLSGTWQVEHGEATFVGYRVDEVLRGIGDFTAVGRTPEVDGSFAAEGTTITAAEIVADLTSLESDNQGRDRQMQRQGLETDEFPEASFVLTAPIDVGSLPAEGETISLVAAGDLTIHGVTNPVELTLEGAVQSGRVIVVGSTEILLSDYGIDPPSAPIVASVEDRGVMELSLVFVPG